jgi:predicted nucleic acid-binding protein
LSVLVDTSVWIDHLRRTSSRLAELLNTGAAATHPFVVGELACGNIQNREQILGLLQALPTVPQVEYDEALRFLKAEKLHGRGLGWVDVNLLASSRLEGIALWTLDKRLASAAERLGIRSI